MAHKAALTKRFLRELKKQSNSTKEKVIEAIDEITENPYLGTKLSGELEGRWRWRIGDYRVVYLIDETHQLVVFLHIGPRKSIYRDNTSTTPI